MPGGAYEGSRMSITLTARLLRDLLETNPQYKRRWRSRVKRDRSDGLSQAAVAETLALYLWDVGERSDADSDLPRALRDRVRRALIGENLTAETLTWFVRAFDMEEQDQHRLWSVFAGGSESPSDGISHTIVSPRAMAKHQWHRTLALFERYYLGKDGSLMERRTMHTIMALEDGVDGYLFNHEPFADRIEVVHGGTLGSRHEYGGGLQSDDIVLERRLMNGQTVSLEYRTVFQVGRHHPLEVRRPARARSLNVDIAVQFDQKRLPESVWFCTWSDHYDGGPVHEVVADVSGQGSAHRFIPFIEQTVVGFRWEWG
jgi:hypothetical protein